MCVFDTIIIENGKLVHLKPSEEYQNRYRELEERFTEKYPDIDFIEYLLWWDLLIRCKTDEEVKEILKRADEENEKAEEYNKNKKTSFWKKLFGY